MAEHHFLASYNASLSNAAWPEAADFALDGDRIGRFDPARQWPQLFEKPACPCCGCKDNVIRDGFEAYDFSP